jgi:hypothetical protein
VGEYSKGLDLFYAQRARFAKLGLTMKQGHEDLAEKGRQDWMDLTSGQPAGKARARLLRQMGHPFGRTSGGKGRSRMPRKGRLPFLPIGIMSGRLRRAIRRTRAWVAGAVQAFAVEAKGVPYAAYILGDAGTRKMVGRGFQREIVKRWKARNKAFLDTFSDRQKKP